MRFFLYALVYSYLMCLVFSLIACEGGPCDEVSVQVIDGVLTCVYTPFTECTYDDGNICTSTTCHPVDGCYHNICDDSDPCTYDNCDYNNLDEPCSYSDCPDCVISSSSGMDQLCDGSNVVSALTADSITTDTLTITGSKKRGVQQGQPSLVVEGGASFTGGLATTQLITENVMVSGSITITQTTGGGGSSSFDLSKGISTKEINCTTVKVDGPTSVNSLAVTSNAVIGNRLITKDANVTGTIDVPVIHFTPPLNKQWWTMQIGSVFSFPDSITNSGPSLILYVVGNTTTGPKLFEVNVVNTAQLGAKGQKCFLGTCKTGTCKPNGNCP